MPKGKKMLLSEFTGPQSNNGLPSAPSGLPTGPSGMGRRMGGGYGRDDRYGDRGGRYGDRGGYGDRKGGDGEEGRSEGDWRGGGGRSYGGGSRYGGGRYGDRDGGGRYGDRPPRDDGDDFGRSDDARDWRRGPKSGGGGRMGGGMGGGYRDRYGDGGRSGFRDKYGGGGGWGRDGGGGSRDTRPAHLRGLFRKGDSGPDSSATRNAFSSLGSQDVRVQLGGRGPGLKMMAPATMRRDDSAPKREDSKKEAEKKETAKPQKRLTPLEKALEEKEPATNKLLKGGLKKLDMADEVVAEKLAVSIAKGLKEDTIMFDQVEALLLKFALSEGQAARQLAMVFAKLKIECGDGEEGEAAVKKLVEDNKYDALKALKRKKTSAEFNTFLKKLNIEWLKGGPDINSVVQDALDDGKNPEEVVQIVNKTIGEKEDASTCVRVIGDHLAAKVYVKGEKKPNIKEIKAYKPLIARCTQGNEDAGVHILFGLQGGWYKNYGRGEKKAALAAFQELSELKIISHETFEIWRADRADKTKGKPDCLLAVFKFLTELRAKNKPIEPEEGEEGAEGEEFGEEEEEFEHAPTFIN